MRHASIVVITTLVAVVTPTTLLAQQGASSDEQAIRSIIASMDNGGSTPYTDDRVFWSGAYKYPVMGSATPEPVDEPVVQNRVPNSQRSKTTIRKLDFSQARDVAWEFSDTELSFRIKDADGERPNTFMTSTLRVWKKVNGEWKVAAHFNEAHNSAGRMRERIANEQQKK